MRTNIKEQLYNFLESEISSIKEELDSSDIELIYNGHGWNEDSIVLCVKSKDYAIKSDGPHIKLKCTDCDFNLNSDGDHIIDDITNKLSVHNC